MVGMVILLIAWAVILTFSVTKWCCAVDDDEREECFMAVICSASVVWIILAMALLYASITPVLDKPTPEKTVPATTTIPADKMPMPVEKLT